MNNQGKNLFERALETKMQFGTRRSQNAIVFENAVIIKRNFAGRDIPGKTKEGRSFIKTGRRFVLVLTEDMFQALCAEKGTCKYGIWAFDPEENPDLKVYLIEVKIKMESNNPPVLKLYTTNGSKKNVSILNSANMGVLDEIYECDIERIDLTVNPYDPDRTGSFTLWLRDLKLSQTKVEEGDGYWSEFDLNDDNPFGDVQGDPNSEEV